MTFKHSGNLGDLIYSLPVIRHLGAGDLYLAANNLKTKKYDGSDNGLSANSIEMIRPLLECQSYIVAVHDWKSETVDVDLDYFRDKDIQIENLCERILASFHVPIRTIDDVWITCGKKKVASTVISRSARYQNKKINYRHFVESFDDCVFVGLPEEHAEFEKVFSNIKYQPVRDFLEMAEIINGADLFVGNQSFALSLAVAMNKPFLQEYCPAYHDCIFDRKNARYMYVKGNSKT